jgi:streptomycin 6-kinase
VLDIPETVRNKAKLVSATRWLSDLPPLVATIEHDWSITIGRAYPFATEAFVAEAETADGTPVVLKLMVPRDHDAAFNEITTLRLADGRGCVGLLRDDPARGALLLERLGPSLHDLALPIVQRHEVLCATVEQVWRPAPGCGLPTGHDKGQGLESFITDMWEGTGRPCSERAVDDAVACALGRAGAHDDERAVLVHGDVHQWNALQAREGFKLVDPDGLLAEPEYDLGVMMRDDPLELMTGDPRERSRWLAARSGLDEAAIWEWGVAERVATGLLCSAIGLQPVGRDMLRAADHIAALG